MIVKIHSSHCCISVKWDRSHLLGTKIVLSPDKSFPNKLLFSSVCSINLLKTLREKGEIARNGQFLLFPQCFLPFFCHFYPFSAIFITPNIVICSLLIWKSLKFVARGKDKSTIRKAIIAVSLDKEKLVIL